MAELRAGQRTHIVAFTLFLAVFVSGCVGSQPLDDGAGAVEAGAGEQLNGSGGDWSNGSVAGNATGVGEDVSLVVRLEDLESELRVVLEKGGGVTPEGYDRLQEELVALEEEGVNVSVARTLFEQLPDTKHARMEERLNASCPLIFTEYVVDPGVVWQLGQIGVVHGSGTLIVGRSYISTKEEAGAVGVYAPTDMVLDGGSWHESPTTGALPDHTLSFTAGCGVTVSLDHLKEVVPVIKERIPKKNSTATEAVDPVLFRAGERIGSWIPGEGVAAFDFIVEDEDVEHTFFNEDRYNDSHLRNIVCPYDLYRGEKREVYYDLLEQGPGGEQTCGTVSRDVPGAVEGQWFREEDGEVYGSPLPVVETNRITIGNLGETSTRWIYPDNPTYKPAAETEEHCYQFYPDFDAGDGYVYFRVVNASAMDVAFSEHGTCPAVFPAESVRYVR